tara:strand:+ start:290 stop:622 length:333 start_codon:yes stop_codon:yes gene_type:complete
MWKDILKIEPYEMAVAEEFAPEDMKEGRDKRQLELAEGESKKLLDKAMKIDNYVKDNIYGLMTENERKIYDMTLELLRKNANKNDFRSANNLRTSLMVLLRPYNLPRRLP